MIVTLALLIGAGLSLALIRLARTKMPRGELRIYAIGLIVAALLYVVFGVIGRASAWWLAIESLGLVIYSAAALAGLRGWPLLLALGWAAHVAWDVPLHVSGAGAEYTPFWYPWLCVSFDLIMAGAVLSLIRHGFADRRSTA